MATARLVTFPVLALAVALSTPARADDAEARSGAAAIESASAADQPCAADASPAGDAEPEPAADRADAGTTSDCIDAAIADRLAIKRQRRAARPRLYVKHARHELTGGGGYHVSDLYASDYLASAAYTYHMTETTAVELSGAMTYANAELRSALEAGRADVLDEERARVLLLDSLLLWTPAYGKLRLGGQVMRFDIHLDAGFGVVDAPTSRGLAGVAGLGIKLFLNEALALRLDARDRVYEQQLLESSYLVNDLSLTFGLSLFLPTRN